MSPAIIGAISVLPRLSVTLPNNMAVDSFVFPKMNDVLVAILMGHIWRDFLLNGKHYHHIPSWGMLWTETATKQSEFGLTMLGAITVQAGCCCCRCAEAAVHHQAAAKSTSCFTAAAVTVLGPITAQQLWVFLVSSPTRMHILFQIFSVTPDGDKKLFILPRTSQRHSYL